MMRSARPESGAVNLVLKHMPLAVHIAESFYRRAHHGRYRDELADFVQEGYLGLMEAAGWGGGGRYDASRGAFSTYAGHWIRRRLRWALTNGNRVNCRLEQRALHAARPVRPQSRIAADSRGCREQTADHEALGRLERGLSRLGASDLEILHRRYGLGGCRRETLEEIGRTKGRSNQWVSQMEQRALRRLRDILAAT